MGYESAWISVTTDAANTMGVVQVWSANTEEKQLRHDQGIDSLTMLVVQLCEDVSWSDDA